MIEEINDQKFRMTPPPPPPPPPEPTEGEGDAEISELGGGAAEEGLAGGETREATQGDGDDDEDDDLAPAVPKPEQEEEEEWEPPSIEELVGEIEGYCQRLRDLAVEVCRSKMGAGSVGSDARKPAPMDNWEGEQMKGEGGVDLSGRPAITRTVKEKLKMFEIWLTLPLPSSKSTLSQPSKREMYKWSSENWQYNHLSSE